MSFTPLHTTPVPAVSTADKSQPIFPLMIANDGFSEVGEEKEASATCFCGEVQLSFVSLQSVLILSLALNARLTVLPAFPVPFAADGWTRLPGYFRLPLYRLSHRDSVHVCYQLHGCLLAHQIRSWQIEPQAVGSIQHACFWKHDDELFLFQLRHSHV